MIIPMTRHGITPWDVLPSGGSGLWQAKSDSMVTLPLDSYPYGFVMSNGEVFIANDQIESFPASPTCLPNAYIVQLVDSYRINLGTPKITTFVGLPYFNRYGGNSVLLHRQNQLDRVISMFGSHLGQVQNGAPPQL